MKRRESRETAFSLVFEWAFREEETLDEIIENAAQGREIVVDDFAHTLAEKTIASAAELDSFIERYSDNWKINRLSHVTLAVLRLAFCELLYFSDIPAGATINEAVELLKKFATEQDASYANGILGAYERERRGETKPKKVTRISVPKPPQPAEIDSDELIERLAAEIGNKKPDDAE